MVILALISTIIFIVTDVIALKSVLEGHCEHYEFTKEHKTSVLITVIGGGIMYASILSVLVQAL